MLLRHFNASPMWCLQVSADEHEKRGGVWHATAHRFSVAFLLIAFHKRDGLPSDEHGVAAQVNDGLVLAHQIEADEKLRRREISTP